MTPLRKRMIRELELRRKAPWTVTSYVKAVEELARYYRRSPDRIRDWTMRAGNSQTRVVLRVILSKRLSSP